MNLRHQLSSTLSTTWLAGLSMDVAAYQPKVSTDYCWGIEDDFSPYAADKKPHQRAITILFI